MVSMKIAVVIPKYGFVGGAESFAYQVTERLAERNDFDIHVFANKWLPGRAPIKFHNIPKITFPRFLRQISFAYFSKMRIRPHDFDIVHSHDRIFRMDLFTMHGIPHKTWIREARGKRLSLFDRSVAWVEERALNRPVTPMILPVSNLVKDKLLRLYDIPESRIRVIHPGVAIERFSALDRDACRQEVLGRHGLSQGDIIALFVGMNFEIKRLALVLEAVAELVGRGDRNSGLKVLVVGKGKKERYLNMARKLGILERVIFAGVTREVEKYYLASDIFVMPSVFDTFGITVLEAMAAGLPVIITKKVGARDLINHGIQGFVLEENPSASDLCEKFSFLLEKENRIRMGEQAKQVALRYTWDTTADQVAEVYQGLLVDKGLDSP
jgi:UDP-glucose:(heptosyl)LPS alpha-1,3-glucosyltransferase